MKVLILPSRIDTLIADCASWTDFRDLASRQKNTKDMGDLFERLTQLYLQTHPTYRSKIKNVWWCNNGELPEEVRKKLNLPETDEGIDLLCETYSGEYWSVQSKYQTNSDRPLNYKKLSTFLSLSFVTAKGISTGLVVHTSTKKVKKSHLMGNTVELGLQHWLDINDGQWNQILDVCRGNLLQPPEKRKKRKHQELAIEKAKEHFLKKGCNRGKLIMPCGTGKSLIAFWSTQALRAKTVIVAVPSLALVKQSLEDWTSEYLAEGVQPEWIAVCSDDSVGKMREADSTVATVYEAGIPTTTDPIEIADFVQKQSKNPRVIFTTYQSSPKLADACKKQGLTIDLLIADEAHKTVGRKDKKFATLLSDENIKITQRMFMTATERVYRQGSENIASMDDENVYGKIFHQMSFKQAIDDGIICDYKILTVAVSGAEVANLMAEHAEVTAQSGNQKVETDAHNLAAGIAIEKVFEKHKIKHALSFHRSIKRAENFNKQQDAFSGKLGSKLLIENRNISSRLSAGQRSQLLNDFAASERSLISNARCLTEGVDIPSIDCVAFIDPKESTVDIVQAAGRAMRQSTATGKTHGYILLPIIVPDGQDLNQFTESTDFAAVARVITSMSTQDERIVEQLRNQAPGMPPNADDIIIVDADINEALDVDYENFRDLVTTKIWSGVGRANWRPFKEAREFVSSLNILTQKEWKSLEDGNIPFDIPKRPDHIYKNNGWQSWGDWLGTGRVAKQNIVYRSFEDARTFVRSLGLKTSVGWKAYTTSGRKPDDIPSNPNVVYPSEIWKGYGDWLGTGRVANQDLKYLSYEQAKKYLSKFNLTSRSEYESWHASNQRDVSLPKNPEQTYKRQNIWISWGDFLGTGYIAHKNRVYVSYDEACSFIRNAGILSFNDLKEFSKSGKKPDFIPSNPHKEYKGKGWVSYGEFFGTGVVANQNLVYRPFEEARAFVHTLGLRQSKDWQRYVASGEKPDDIPSNIQSVYKDDGYINMGDWLGTGKNRSSAFEFRNFSDARAFVRTLNFKNRDEYTAWAKTSEKPYDIPADPRRVYEKDYTGWSDWLGNGYLAYEQAKKIVHTFNIQTSIAWKKWASSKDRPQNIPSTPQRIYANVGWKDWDDWLGREVSPEILERAQRWEQSFRKLQMFKDREGHCNVPSSLMEDGFNLGSWVGIQRRTQASMPPERKQKLNGIGFVWDTYALAWEKGFNALTIFKAREGHCSVPATHKEGDHSLGSWVRNQRRSKSKVLAERKKRLDELGFIWGGRDF